MSAVKGDPHIELWYAALIILIAVAFTILAVVLIL